MSMESELLRSLFHIKNLLFSEMAKSFLDEGLTPIEVMVLYRVTHGKAEQKVNELTKTMGIPPSTLTGILDRLVDKGYILRERNGSDRRVVTVKTNPERRMSKETGKPVSHFLQTALSDVEPGWVEDLTEKLKRLEKILEENKVKD
jgi:DNA-binding MarR family transcriptional regulator